MSIHNKIKIINRVDNIASEIKNSYSQDTPAYNDLNKLSQSLKRLTDYLSNLDQLQPNYTTNEVDKHMNAINLDLDILKGELEKKDYSRLYKGSKAIKAILKFHPTKYSFFEFIVIWIYELIYFI